MSTEKDGEDALDAAPRRARAVSQVLISSALAITLASALAGSERIHAAVSRGNSGTSTSSILMPWFAPS